MLCCSTRRRTTRRCAGCCCRSRVAPPGEKVTVVVGETMRKRDLLAEEILF